MRVIVGKREGRCLFLSCNNLDKIAVRILETDNLAAARSIEGFHAEAFGVSQHRERGRVFSPQAERLETGLATCGGVDEGLVAGAAGKEPVFAIPKGCEAELDEKLLHLREVGRAEAHVRNVRDLDRAHGVFRFVGPAAGEMSGARSGRPLVDRRRASAGLAPQARRKSSAASLPPLRHAWSP